MAVIKDIDGTNFAFLGEGFPYVSCSYLFWYLRDIDTNGLPLIPGKPKNRRRGGCGCEVGRAGRSRHFGQCRDMKRGRWKRNDVRRKMKEELDRTRVSCK
jgi:hypothetical protein